MDSVFYKEIPAYMVERTVARFPKAFNKVLSGLDADAVILEIVERNLSLLLPDEEASS